MVGIGLLDQGHGRSNSSAVDIYNGNLPLSTSHWKQAVPRLDPPQVALVVGHHEFGESVARWIDRASEKMATDVRGGYAPLGRSACAQTSD
jgi:hypothetical protein